MLRTVASLVLCLSPALCLSPGVWAQTAAQPPAQPATQSATQSATPLQFEVASVKPSPADRPPGDSGGRTKSGRLTMENVSLKRCMMGAFHVGQNEILGGPDWLESARFDIVARASEPVDDDAVMMDMLKSLLAERFKLTFHRETRMIQAYVLSVAKNGPKLAKSPGGEAATINGRGSLEVRATTMDAFAARLGRQMDLPVVNRTALAGQYDFKLEWAPEGAQPDPANPDPRPSIFTAIQQLGLRLTTQKTPIHVIVIDHAQMPSEN